MRDDRSLIYVRQPYPDGPGPHRIDQFYLIA